MRSSTHTKQQHSLAQHNPTAYGTRGTRCPVQQVNYAKSPKNRPNPRTDADVTEDVVVDTTASSAKSSKRVTANSCPKYASKQPAKYASGCGLTETGYFLKKVRMVMIEAHASQRARLTLESFLSAGNMSLALGLLQ